MKRDAYDLIHELNKAGTTLYVRSGERLTWECDRRRPVPMDVLAELPLHKEEIIGILLHVPSGCPVPNICREIGICHREISHSACALASSEEDRDESEEAA